MRLQSNITIMSLVWIVSLVAPVYLGFSYFPHPQNINFWQSLSNFDGGHYLSIARNGYLAKEQYAFFPLYPLLINLFAKITGDYLVAGLLISLVCLFLSLKLLNGLINFEFGKKYGTKGVLSLLLFPMSFYFLTVYTESLFLFLALSTFLAMKKRNFFLATVTCALGSATRISGIPLVLSFLTFVHLSSGLRKNWYVILAPAGLVAYCIFLFNQTGDPFYFAKAQLNWHDHLVVPGSSLVFLAKKMLDPYFVINSFRDVLDFIFVIFGLIFSWRVFKKLSLEYAVFAVISIMLPLFSPTIAPMPRYILTIFPIFVVLALEKDEYFWMYRIISPMLLVVFAILFVTRAWGV